MLVVIVHTCSVTLHGGRCLARKLLDQVLPVASSVTIPRHQTIDWSCHSIRRLNLTGKDSGCRPVKGVFGTIGIHRAYDTSDKESALIPLIACIMILSMGYLNVCIGRDITDFCIIYRTIIVAVLFLRATYKTADREAL